MADERAARTKLPEPNAPEPNPPLAQLRFGKTGCFVSPRGRDVGLAIADAVREGAFRAPVFADLRSEIAILARLDKDAILRAVLEWLCVRGLDLDDIIRRPGSEGIRKLADALLEQSRRRGTLDATPKAPSDLAFQCWRLYRLSEINQTEIAKMLSAERGKALHQGTVAKHVKMVDAYLGAGNPMPPIEEATGKPIVKTVNPRKLDYQEKPDGRTRPRRSPLQEGAPPEED